MSRAARKTGRQQASGTAREQPDLGPAHAGERRSFTPRCPICCRRRVMT